MKEALESLRLYETPRVEPLRITPQLSLLVEASGELYLDQLDQDATELGEYY